MISIEAEVGHLTEELREELMVVAIDLQGAQNHHAARSLREAKSLPQHLQKEWTRIGLAFGLAGL